MWVSGASHGRVGLCSTHPQHEAQILTNEKSEACFSRHDWVSRFPHGCNFSSFRSVAIGFLVEQYAASEKHLAGIEGIWDTGIDRPSILIVISRRGQLPPSIMKANGVTLKSGN